MDPILVAVVFFGLLASAVGLWLLGKLLVFVRSRSGWAALARIYETSARPGPNAIARQSGEVTLLDGDEVLSTASMIGTMTYEAREDGLYQRSALQFWRPAVLIPWADLRRGSAGPFPESCYLEVKSDALHVRICVPLQVLEDRPLS